MITECVLSFFLLRYDGEPNMVATATNMIKCCQIIVVVLMSSCIPHTT